MNGQADIVARINSEDSNEALIIGYELELNGQLNLMMTNHSYIL